ncbi:hypothetical protein SAMN05421770_104129 [Granulicella rosea]|uniref:Uncharacterized protein n=1 Tax=Granulicella rosea TaxID=474952 RepID=A0A239JWU8_9BACT|nr:hypothetical protein [Granulicella rosea]SNT09294.1 hypothetical protein SAMN05421770_104129 [Granulicella rosea]
MSDNYIIFVPEDPRFVPSADRIADGLSVAARLFPKADAIKADLPGGIECFDAGGNFESTTCPGCGKKLPDAWWATAADADQEESGFRLGVFRTPCCASDVTLNDLRYEWPQRFGMFGLEIQNPNVGLLAAGDVVALESAVGTFLRVVYRHL